MLDFQLRTEIHSCKTAAEFAEAFQLGAGDLVITNAFIYEPFFGELSLGCDVLYQEKYGSGEPSDQMVEAMYHDVAERYSQYRRIIAIGGGTVIDISKLFALKQLSPVLDLYDGKIPTEKARQLVIVPTTCGTGSEVTNIAILALESRHTKKGLACEAMYADQAVLIPQLLEGLPFRFFATSSIDALIHAVESCLSPKGNDLTRMFSYKAIRMILEGYQKIAAEGQEARFPLLDNFLKASNYAGIAFGNAGCAAVHALSYPLGALYHVPHGEANYAMFTGVMKNYMELRQDGELETLNHFIAGILDCPVSEVYEALETLLNCVIDKKPLHAYGMKQEEIVEFTDSVIENQQRLLKNNYVPLDRDRIIKIYTELY